VKDLRQARGDAAIRSDFQDVAARGRPAEPAPDGRQIGPAGFGNPRTQGTGLQAGLDGCQRGPTVNKEHIGVLGAGHPAQRQPHGGLTESGVQNQRPLAAQRVPGTLQQTIIDLAGRRRAVAGRLGGATAAAV
jgi:hypothetical protein